MTVAGSLLTTLADSLMSNTWHRHCFCHHSCPKLEHVDPMVVEVLLCVTKALSALFGPVDYPRLFLSDLLLILLQLCSLFSALPPTQLSR